MKYLDEITGHEGFLDEILNTIPSGVFVTDLDFTIIMVNRAGAQLAGRSPGDCFDRKCYEVIPTSLCNTENCPLMEAKTLGKSVHGQATLYARGGEIPIEYTGRPLRNFEGEIIGYVEHIADISETIERERVILEQQDELIRLLSEKAQHTRELERLNEQLVNLASDLEALAHEHTLSELALEIADRFRNPAFAIGGLLQKLKTVCQEHPTGKKYLEACLAEAQKLESRVKAFEALSKKRTVFFKQLDLRELVKDAIKTWQGTFFKKGISYNLAMPDTPLHVKADERTFKVALLHVLKNAAEASPPNGTIEISVVPPDMSGPQVVVRDHGPGIPESVLKRLFKERITTKSSGHGLGLMLVKRIMREHQGDVIIERPSNGPGTIVRLTFPRRWRERTQHKD